MNLDRTKVRNLRRKTWNLACGALLSGLLLDARSAAAARGLWVANGDSSTVAEFQGLATARPHRIINSADLDGSSTVAFDQDGNLWESNFNTNSIVEFTNSQIRNLKKNRAPSATVTISQDAGGALNGPEGMAFDASGNLWVGSERGQTVLEYSAAQLTASGNPTPNVILNANSFSFSSPSNPVFDNAGNLWVVDEDLSNGNGGTGEIFEYTSAQITGMTAGANNVDPILGIASPGFVHLEGLAFDRNGNLWVADELANSVDEILTSQIAGSGLSQNITPAVVLTATTLRGACSQSLDAPYGVAVDQSGKLLVSNAGQNSAGCLGSLSKFSARAIRSSGSPRPIMFLRSNLSGTNFNSPNNLTFGPTVP